MTQIKINKKMGTHKKEDRSRNEQGKACKSENKHWRKIRKWEAGKPITEGWNWDGHSESGGYYLLRPQQHTGLSPIRARLLHWYGLLLTSKHFILSFIASYIQYNLELIMHKIRGDSCQRKNNRAISRPSWLSYSCSWWHHQRLQFHWYDGFSTISAYVTHY